jgi:hypothetical protein
LISYVVDNPISKASLPPEVVEDMQRFLLIPGGRYLLVASTRMLRLLDLELVRTQAREGRAGAACIVTQIELAVQDTSSRLDEFQFICNLIAENLEDGDFTGCGCVKFDIRARFLLHGGLEVSYHCLYAEQKCMMSY